MESRKKSVRNEGIDESTERGFHESRAPGTWGIRRGWEGDRWFSMGSERFNAAGERLENPRPKPTSLWTRCFSQGPPYYVDLSLCVGCSICLRGPVRSIDLPAFRQGTERPLFTGARRRLGGKKKKKKIVFLREKPLPAAIMPPFLRPFPLPFVV